MPHSLFPSHALSISCFYSYSNLLFILASKSKPQWTKCRDVFICLSWNNADPSLFKSVVIQQYLSAIMVTYVGTLHSLLPATNLAIAALHMAKQKNKQKKTEISHPVLSQDTCALAVKKYVTCHASPVSTGCRKHSLPYIAETLRQRNQSRRIWQSDAEWPETTATELPPLRD